MGTPPLTPCLEVRHLSKRFGALEVLRGISFTLAEGETLGIIGPNGAGKSTLFHIIAGTVPPTAGQVFFYGQEVTRRPPDHLCRLGLARTFQVPQIFPRLTVLENIMLGAWFGRHPAPSETRARDQARELLHLLGLEGKETSLAKDLTLMQQRLVELGRALATQPKLLLLDELAAGLSLRAVHQLVEVIMGLKAKGLSLLLTDHLLYLVVPVSDRLVALDEGRIIAQGAPEEVIHHPLVEAAYLGLDGTAQAAC